ncbi:MAG TPA: sugar phosphate isomerase/epimerase [Roseiflexaceae bacterium]|nr:sugar phosphate isomerase/epimerase [Roseiflexaceae bacterium]
MANPISIQMYTLRDDTAQDFAGTLREVAKLGFGAVELAGYGTMTVDQLKQELDSLGLQVSGAHTALNRLEGDLDAVISEMKTLGSPYVICPFLPPDRRPDAKGYATLAHLLDEIGAKCRAAGLQLAYHHHDFELQRFGDTTGLHILMNESNPDNLKAEIDVYWAAVAGFEPPALLRELGDRVRRVHLKDMTPAPESTFAEVGHGVLDIPAILQAADDIKADWLIVEQDRCARPALESVGMSLEYLRSLGRS